MSFPTEVHDVRAKDGTEFDLQGNPMKVRTYRFWVGLHGPFEEKFYAGEQDTPSVERRIGLVVSTLRDQGLIPMQ